MTAGQNKHKPKFQPTEKQKLQRAICALLTCLLAYLLCVVGLFVPSYELKSHGARAITGGDVVTGSGRVGSIPISTTTRRWEGFRQAFLRWGRRGAD